MFCCSVCSECNTYCHCCVCYWVLQLLYLSLKELNNNSNTIRYSWCSVSVVTDCEFEFVLLLSQLQFLSLFHCCCCCCCCCWSVLQFYEFVSHTHSNNSSNNRNNRLCQWHLAHFTFFFSIWKSVTATATSPSAATPHSLTHSLSFWSASHIINNNNNSSHIIHTITTQTNPKHESNSTQTKHSNSNSNSYVHSNNNNTVCPSLIGTTSNSHTASNTHVSKWMSEWTTQNRKKLFPIAVAVTVVVVVVVIGILRHAHPDRFILIDLQSTET